MKELKLKNDEIVDSIINYLKNGMYFEDIYKTVKHNFRSRIEFYDYIGDVVIRKYGEANFSKYINDYYIANYNNEFKWKNPGFVEFWQCKGFKDCIYSSKNLCNLAKEEHENVIRQLLNIPKEYLDSLDQAVYNNLRINSSSYGYIGYQKYWSYNAFIDKYFSTYLTELQVNNYCQSMLNSYNLVTDEFEFTGFLKYCFGDEFSKNYTEKYKSTFFDIFRLHTIPYRYARMSYKSIVSIVNSVNISTDEKQKYLAIKNRSIQDYNKKIDILEEKNTWDNYSEDEIKKRLDDAFKIFRMRRENIAKSRIFEILYGLSTDISKKYIDVIFDRGKNKKLIDEYINENKIEILNHFINTNYESMEPESDIWKLYYRDKQTITYYKLDFSKLPKLIARDLKVYTRSEFIQDNFMIRKYEYLITTFKGLVELFGVESINDVKENMILELLHIEKSDNGKSGNTLRGRLYVLNDFYDFMGSREGYNDTISCPTKNVHIRNVHRNTEHIKPIPPEVRFAIELHLDEVDRMTRIMYLIFAETGFRFGEKVDCRVSDIKKDDENPEMAIIYYYQKKTQNSNIKHGTNDKKFVHITIGLYHEIMKYIEETKVLRDKYKEDVIFISERKDGIRCKISSSKSSRHINNLIKKYNITTAEGDLWKWENRQMRKTVAVDLISNEKSTVYHVQNLLDHTSPRTTEIYYAEVDNIKIMKKNTDFFKQKFSMYVKGEHLKHFTEEERRILYIDFLRNYREVEFGYCCRHQSEGSCEFLGENLCADCAKIVTGKKFIDKWQRLYNDSSMRVDEFIEAYNLAGINEKEYNTFKEYKKEKNLMIKYKGVIDAILQLD